MVSLFGRGFDSLQLHSINQETAEYQRFLFLFLYKRYTLYYISPPHSIFRKSITYIHSISSILRFIGSRETTTLRLWGKSAAKAFNPFRWRGITSSTDLISIATRTSDFQWKYEVVLPIFIIFLLMQSCNKFIEIASFSQSFSCP